MMVKQVSRSQSGATMVEAAISLPVFLLVILSGTLLAVTIYRYVSLQYTVNRTARWAVLGESTGTLSRELSIEDKAVEIGNVYGLDFGSSHTTGVDHPGISICTPVGPCGSDDAGAPEEYFQITITQPVALFGLNIDLTATALARNEPYSVI